MTSVFLSYARGDDGEPFDPETSFVTRLHHSLVTGGFEVWFDRVSMPSRSLTFHQEIRDAVATHDRLVLVVGPKAAESAYVRQEWQFAYFEAEKIVTPILRDGDYANVPGELKLLHCEDFRDDVQYEFHLENLIRELAEPAPALGKLIAVPSLPAHFLSRTERLTVLRDALRPDLDSPVVITGAAARVGIHGMGGIGKSVLASALARDRKVREAFPDGIVWVELGPLPKIADLQRRIHKDLGGEGAFQTEHEGRVKLREMLKDKRVLLILDNAWRREDVDWFDILGPRCRAMISTRDSGLLSSLGGVHHLVELLTYQEALNILAQATGVEREELPIEATALVKECGRLPLAVALCGGMIRRGLTWGAVLQQLQQARIDRIADRHAIENHHQSVWHAIHVSIEFLPNDERQRFLELAVFPSDETIPKAAVGVLWAYTEQLDDWAAEELLITLRERSLIQMVTNDNQPGIALHDLVHDYLRRSVVNARAMHAQLLAAYWAKCKEGWPTGPNDGYFFTRLRRHLVEAGRASELADLLQELRWLERKNEAGLTFDLQADFGSTAAAISADDMRGEVLRLLSEAIRTHVHFIAHHSATYPQGLIQSVVNHLWPIASGMPFQGRSTAGYQEVARSIKALCSRWEDEAKLRGLAWLKLEWLDRETILGGPLKWQLKMRERPPAVVAFSPTGDMIAGAAGWPYSNRTDPPSPWSAGYDLSIWSTDTGALIQQLFPDPTVLAFDGPPRNVPRPIHPKIQRAYDDYFAGLDSGRDDFRSAVSNEWRDALIAGDIRALCWMQDDTLLAGCRGGRVFVWNAWRGQFCGFIQMSNIDAMFEIRNWNETVASSLACLAPDQFVVGSSFGTIHRFSSHASFHEIQQLAVEPENGYNGNKNQILSLAFHAASRRLAVGCLDRVIRVIDVDSWQVLRHLHGHQQDVTGVAWSPDGSRLASASFDKTLRVWNVDKECECWPPIPHPMDSIAVTWGFETDEIMATWNRNGIGGSVRVWSAVDGRLITEFGSVPALYDSLAATTNKRLIATGSLDGMIRVWDPASLGFSFRPRECHEGTVRSATANLGRMEIATLGLDGMRVWSIVTGELRGKVERDWSDWVNQRLSIHSSPDGQYLLAVTGNQLNMFDTEQLSLLWTKRTGAHDIIRCFFSSDSRIFLTDDGRAPNTAFIDKGSGVIVWEAKTGECLHRSSGAGVEAEDRFQEYEAQVSSVERPSVSSEVEQPRLENGIGWRSYNQWKRNLNTTEVRLVDESGQKSQLLLSGSFKYECALTDFGKWVVVLAGGSAPRMMTAQLPNKAKYGLEGKAGDPVD